jgi:acetate kinase
MNHEKFNADQIDDILNKESWLLGVSWISSDMRDILAGIEKWDKKCILALDMYINSMVKYIWAYAALLWGIDTIVLTAGVMEHRAIVRKMLLEKLSSLWIILDSKANQDELPGGKIISTPDSKVAVIVIPTNEEYMIAKETMALI